MAIEYSNPITIICLNEITAKDIVFFPGMESSAIINSFLIPVRGPFYIYILSSDWSRSDINK